MRPGNHAQLNINTIQKCLPKLKFALLQNTEQTPSNESGAQNKHI